MIGATLMGVALSFYRLKAISEERETKRDQEMKAYIDKEVQFVREIYTGQITELNKKVDRLLDLIEKLREEIK